MSVLLYRIIIIIIIAAAPALACARPKVTDKKANRFMQKCQKKFKITATFFSLSTDPSRAAF